MKDLEQPVSLIEQYMYAQVVRLDALCNMMSSLVEHIAKQNGIATTNHVEEAPKKASPKKKVKE